MLAHEPEAEQGLKPRKKVFSCGSLVSPFSGQVLIANRYLPEKMTNNLCFALSPCGLHKSQISADMLSTYPLLAESPKQEALFSDVVNYTKVLWACKAFSNKKADHRRETIFKRRLYQGIIDKYSEMILTI
jgi:hypothetical protein